MQIRFMMMIARFKDPVVISAIPTSAVVLNRLRYAAHIYYLKDNFSEYYENMSFCNVKENDVKLRDSSDYVICSSKGLYDQVRAKRGDIKWIPHGVHAQYLNYDKYQPEPEWLVGIPHPRITFWGQLENLMNAPLMIEIAQDRPDWNLIFIGPKTHDYGKLETLPNVHFFPRKPAQEIIAAGLHSDILSMPWIETEWIKFSCPIKFREYLAIGKPIVSVPIIEVEQAYPHAAKIAKNKREWIEKIEESLAENTPEQEEYRRSLVRHYDTAAAARMFTDTIEEALKSKACVELPA